MKAHKFYHCRFAAELLRFPGVFERQGDGVALCAGLATPQQRTAAVETVMESLNGGAGAPWRLACLGLQWQRKQLTQSL